MSDLISRQAVDDVIYDYSRSCDVDYAQIMEYIDKIPPVENKGEWTPASNPPKESGRYLTYIVNEYDEELQYIMTADYIARPRPIEGLSPWYVDDECASDNVVAWMPLPEPYNPNKESEDA